MYRAECAIGGAEDARREYKPLICCTATALERCAVVAADRDEFLIAFR